MLEFIIFVLSLAPPLDSLSLATPPAPSSFESMVDSPSLVTPLDSPTPTRRECGEDRWACGNVCCTMTEQCCTYGFQDGTKSQYCLDVNLKCAGMK